MAELNLGELMTELFTSMVKDKGFPVLRETEYCKKHQKTHSNCLGCESEQGCKKVAKLMLLFAMAGHHKPKSFKEEMEASEILDNKIKEILEVS